MDLCPARPFPHSETACGGDKEATIGQGMGRMGPENIDKAA